MDEQIANLEAILKQQLSGHKQLLSFLARKRQALRSAHHDQMTSLTEKENRVVQEISELEKQRLTVVGELTLMVDPSAKEPLRLAQLAERLGEPHRGRLLVLRQELVLQMKQVQDETNVVKRATASLVQHMQGLIQTVGSAITGVGVYSQKGRVPQEALALSTFNTTG